MIPFLFPIPRWLLPLGLCALIFAVGGLGFWRGMVAIEQMTASAAQASREERDRYWEAEIAKANAIHEAARAAQVAEALRAEAEARQAQSVIQNQLRTLEARNAALPQGGRCGVDRARIRLLQGNR